MKMLLLKSRCDKHECSDDHPCENCLMLSDLYEVNCGNIGPYSYSLNRIGKYIKYKNPTKDILDLRLPCPHTDCLDYNDCHHAKLHEAIEECDDESFIKDIDIPCEQCKKYEEFITKEETIIN